MRFICSSSTSLAFVRSGWCDARQRIQTCSRIGRDIGSIQNQSPIEGHIDRRAAWQLCFRPARGQDGDECTNSRGATANPCSATGCVIGDFAGKSANIGAATAGHQHRGGVSRLARRPLDFAFAVNAFLSIAVHAAWCRPQLNRVAIRIGHLLERDTKLAAALDAAWPLCFENLATYERA